MPTVREPVEYVDLDKTFAQEIKVRTTSWTLDELLKAAGAPDDVEINGEYHYDDHGYTCPLSRNSTIAVKVEKFNMDGKKLRRVVTPTIVAVQQTQYVTTYEEEPCEAV